MSLTGKLELLGEAGRARLRRAWDDPELDVKQIKERFGLHATETVKLRELFGPRPKAPLTKTWIGRRDRESGVVRSERGRRL